MRRLHARRRSRVTAGRLLALATLGVAAVPLAGLVGGGDATALAPTASAYWVKLGASLPTVPKGGLAVGADPGTDLSPASPVGGSLPTPVTTPSGVPQSDVTGPTAMSAVQVVDVSTTDAATLSLKVASGSLPSPSAATILACPLPGGFHAPSSEPADISTAPGYNCASSSSGKVAADGSSISWLLPESFQSTPGELDVALVPDPTSATPFEVSFDPPGLSAVTAASGAPMAPPAAEPAASTADSTPADQSAPVAADTGTGSGFTDSGPVASPSPPATSAPTPASNLFPSLPISVHLLGDDRAHRMMAVALLILIAGAWWYVGGRPAPMPRLLGALAQREAAPAPVRQGGIGRFTRPRTEPPRRLQ